MLQITGKQEMFIPLIEQQAYRIIILIAATVLIVVIIEDFHFDPSRKFVNALCTVRFFPTLESRVMRRTISYGFLELIQIFSVRCRIAARRFHLLIGKRKGNDRFTRKAVKHAGAIFTSRKACDMVAVRMGHDHIFQYIIRTILLYILRRCIRTAFNRPCVDQNIRITGFYVNTVARGLVPQFHKMNGQLSARINVAALRALYICIKKERRYKADRERQQAGYKGKACGKFLFSH